MCKCTPEIRTQYCGKPGYEWPFKKLEGLDLAYDKVKEFHRTFLHPVSEKPTMLSKERVRTRYYWMFEELEEFYSSDNVVDQTDAMIDLIYFALGTLVEMGVKPQVPFEIVQKANMDKLWPDGKPHFDENTKTIKPEGWKDPYPLLLAEIKNQGGDVEGL